MLTNVLFGFFQIHLALDLNPKKHLNSKGAVRVTALDITVAIGKVQFQGALVTSLLRSRTLTSETAKVMS